MDVQLVRRYPYNTRDIIYEVMGTVAGAIDFDDEVLVPQTYYEDYCGTFNFLGPVRRGIFSKPKRYVEFSVAPYGTNPKWDIVIMHSGVNQDALGEAAARAIEEIDRRHGVESSLKIEVRHEYHS